MITGMNHTGFVVKDLEGTIAFYRDVMGLTVDDPIVRQGAPISQVVGYEHTHLIRAFLHFGDGHNLELLQYYHPPSGERPAASAERNTIGASHLAFDVDDIEATYQDLVGRGARGLKPPAEVAPGRKACYLQDPDGNWIELMQLEE